MTTDCGPQTPPPGTDDLLPTRRSLLNRLRDWQDHTSWQEFFDTYWRLIYNVAVKAGLSPSEAEEVVQETVMSVAKAMKGFRYDPARGSFKGWLLQLTGWRITNQFKRRSQHAPLATRLDEDATQPPEATETEAAFAVPPDLERLWEEEWEQNLMQAALGRVRRQVNPKQFQVFDLYVLQQRPVREVREFLGVSHAEVYLAKHRVGKLVRSEVTRLRQRLV
jgi:RNA polymerase sigma-70 factor (ECF subfamily)